MEGELFQGLYRLIQQVDKLHAQPKGVHFSDARIVEVLLWAVLHDRPTCWACQRRHWPAHRRCHPLPTPATMSRRLRTCSVLFFLAAMEAALQAAAPRGLVQSVDAMPLPVGGWSKDRDAKWGRAANGFAKGYKLFARVAGGWVMSWRIGPMNQSESQTAIDLLTGAEGGGYLLGDALYDSNALHRVAQAAGWQLVAPRKKPGRGLGHGRHEPGRLRSIALLEGPGPFGRSLYACRTVIERDFAHAGCFPGGLGPLPRWVGRPRRVALWVQVKLLIYGIRLQQRQQAAGN